MHRASVQRVFRASILAFCASGFVVGAACTSSTDTPKGAIDASITNVPDGQTASPDGTSNDAPSTVDSATDASNDTSQADVSDDTLDAGNTCAFGTAQTSTDGSTNLFGDTVYYDNGNVLPAGRYRIEYVDGCMKYASTQGWTINAYPADSGPATSVWRVVGDTTSVRYAIPPGTEGYAVGSGAFANFDDCVTASKTYAPVEFDLPAPSKIGIWLDDTPYTDNVFGENDRNPKWTLTYLAACDAGGGG